jgi:hypothetical protein
MAANKPGPYSDITERLTRDIGIALAQCYQTLKNEVRTPDPDQVNFLRKVRRIINDIDDVTLSAQFAWLGEMRSGTPAKDRHLFTGPNPRASIRTLRSEYRSRISGLIKNSVINAFEEDRIAGSPTLVYVPSALSIALDFLTDPNEPASRAYAFFAVRRYLQETCDIAAFDPKTGESGPITYEAIADRISTISTHLRRGPRGDAIDHTSKNDAYFIYHFLAMRRIIVGRFTASLRESDTSPETTVERFDLAIEAAIGYLKRGEIVPSEEHLLRPAREKESPSTKFEFVASQFVERLPDASSLFNDIHGVPLPLRGADAIFLGGLRPSENLVLGVRGHPGSGKTSFGLSLAAILSPFGTRTLYVSAEEDPKRLKDRLQTITPLYLRETSFFDDTFSWFRSEHLTNWEDTGDRRARIAKLKTFLGLLRQWLGEPAVQAKDNKTSPPFRLLVVLDSVHAYFSDRADKHLSLSINTQSDAYDVDDFIRDCGKLNAIVAVISSADEKAISPLDYLADIAIELDYRQTSDPSEKPYRLFILKKTRHQASRPGAHIFHISGSKGFRLSPQLSSQIDKGAVSTQRSPDVSGREGWYDILGRNFPDPTQGVRQLKPLSRGSGFLRLFPDSHVLIHGTGSGGKAGLGLKILTAPLVHAGSVSNVPEIDDGHVPRVLVVSFLYQRDIYHALLSGLLSALAVEYGSSQEIRAHIRRLRRSESLDVMHCYPGHLRAEDLFSKIDSALTRAELEGLPYTGVLLDGLHNVFIQFPELERNQMFWPMLYALMRTRKNLTVVTTHTSITIGRKGEEYEYKIRQDRPFLQALIQATDFYMELYGLENAVPNRSLFELAAKSSIGQAIPADTIFWSREALISFVGRRSMDLFNP